MSQRIRVAEITDLGGKNIVLTGKGVSRLPKNGGELFDKTPYELYHNQGLVPSDVSAGADDYVHVWAGGPITGRNEVQTITFDAVADSGDIKLGFRGQETGALAFDANTATIKAALEGLSTIGAGNIDVTGDIVSQSLVVTFINDLGAEDLPLLTYSDNNLVIGATPIVVDVAQTVIGAESVDLDPDLDMSGVYQLVVDENDTVVSYTTKGGNVINFLEKIETVRNKDV